MEAAPVTPPAGDPVIEVTDLVKEYRGSDGSVAEGIETDERGYPPEVNPALETGTSTPVRNVRQG